MIEFEWNPAKADSNKRKHGVSFDEAMSIFYDECATQFYDDAHSELEDRFLMLGLSSGSRVLMVCHYEEDAGNVIRIISARKATKSERRFYQSE